MDIKPIHELKTFFDSEMSPVEDGDPSAVFVRVTTYNYEGEIAHERLMSLQKKALNKESFNEEDHPRGQPDNAGQFASKSGGSKTTLEDFNKKWLPQMNRNGYYHDFVTKAGLNPQFESKKTNDLMSYEDLSELGIGVSNADGLEKWNMLKDNYMKMIENTPELKKNFDELKEDVDKQNTRLQEKFEKSPSFYRGSTIDELMSIVDGDDNYLDNDDSPYDFESLSMNISEVMSLYNGGLIIQYDGDSVREKGKPVKYSAEPRPYIHANPDYGIKDDEIETIDTEYPSLMINEEEVRVDRIDVEDLKIKSITIHLTQTAKDLSELSNIFGIPDYNKEWIAGVEAGKDYKVIKRGIIDKLEKDIKNSKVSSSIKDVVRILP